MMARKFRVPIGVCLSLSAIFLLGLVPTVLANSKPGCATVVVTDSAGNKVVSADVVISNSTYPNGFAAGPTGNSGRTTLACGQLSPGLTYDVKAAKGTSSAAGPFTADQRGTIFAQLTLAP